MLKNSSSLQGALSLEMERDMHKIKILEVQTFRGRRVEFQGLEFGFSLNIYNGRVIRLRD